MFLYVCKRAFRISKVWISQRVKGVIMRNLCVTVFYIKTNVLQNFHICISVPSSVRVWIKWFSVWVQLQSLCFAQIHNICIPGFFIMATFFYNIYRPLENIQCFYHLPKLKAILTSNFGIRGIFLILKKVFKIV